MCTRNSVGDKINPVRKQNLLVIVSTITKVILTKSLNKLFVAVIRFSSNYMHLVLYLGYML